jgi:hypothetical protein
MKARDLIAKLQNECSSDDEVFLAVPANDRFEKIKVIPVATAEIKKVTECVYHDCLVAVQSSEHEYGLSKRHHDVMVLGFKD